MGLFPQKFQMEKINSLEPEIGGAVIIGERLNLERLRYNRIPSIQHKMLHFADFETTILSSNI